MDIKADELRTKDRVISDVGLPSPGRYNFFVAQAVSSMESLHRREEAIVWATLALAEAQLVGE